MILYKTLYFYHYFPPKPPICSAKLWEPFSFLKQLEMCNFPFLPAQTDNKHKQASQLLLHEYRINLVLFLAKYAFGKNVLWIKNYCKIHTVQLPQLAEPDFALSILVRTLGAHLRESQRACLFPLFWWINAPMGVSFVIQMTSTELNWFLMRKFEKWNSFMKGKYMIFHAASLPHYDDGRVDDL